MGRQGIKFVSHHAYQKPNNITHTHPSFLPCLYSLEVTPTFFHFFSHSVSKTIHHAQPQQILVSGWIMTTYYFSQLFKTPLYQLRELFKVFIQPKKFLSRWTEFPLLLKWEFQEQNLFENMNLKRILILLVHQQSQLWKM